MKITFYTRGIELDDQMRIKIKEKFDRLNRYFKKLEKYSYDDTLNIDIHIDFQKGLYNVKTILNLDGQDIVVKDNANNLLDVINSIIDTLEVKLSRYRDKVITGHRHKIRITSLEENNQTNNQEVDIVRKRLELPVISEKKAISFLLQDKDSSFLVFYNRDTDKINILSRSEEGFVLTELVL